MKVGKLEQVAVISALFILFVIAMSGMFPVFGAESASRASIAKQISVEEAELIVLGQTQQVLRVTNQSGHDVKDIEIDCYYFSESGARASSLRRERFLLVFPAHSYRDVLLEELPVRPDAKHLRCEVTELKYASDGPVISSGTPRLGLPSISDGSARPIRNEWGNR